MHRSLCSAEDDHALLCMHADAAKLGCLIDEVLILTGPFDMSKQVPYCWYSVGAGSIVSVNKTGPSTWYLQPGPSDKRQ